MKILILTGKFGMGHYQAAQAIKEELENNPKDDIEIIDWIEYLTPRLCEIHLCRLFIPHRAQYIFLQLSLQEVRELSAKPDPGSRPRLLCENAPSDSAETSGSDYLRSGILLSGRFLL